MEIARLIFFKPNAEARQIATGHQLLLGSASHKIASLDPQQVLQWLKSKRGFGRMKLSIPTFELDNERLEVSMEGTAYETHLDVRFFGNFEKLAEPLFKAMTADGFACYSVADSKMLTAWPEWDEPTIDSGFGARMTRVLERETKRLAETEPDRSKHAKILAAFVQSPEFKLEMASEARNEPPSGKHKKRSYTDLVNCYARWKSTHPTAMELAAVRNLVPKFKAMGIADLKSIIADAPRLLLLTAATTVRANAMRESALNQDLQIDIEPVRSLVG